MKRLQLDERTHIAYSEQGEGEQTLLFIHGLGSNHKAWQKNTPFLKKNLRCITIDLPGYGASSKKEYDFSMRFFAEHLISFIEQAGLSNLTMVGHSMGGQIAIHTVLLRQELIQQLVLVAPAGFETFTEDEGIWLKKIIAPPLTKSLSEEQIIQNFRANFYDFPSDAQFMIDDRMKLRSNPTDYSYFCNMVSQCVAAMLAEPIFNRLSDIHIPVLTFFGKNDQLIPNAFLHPKLSPQIIGKKGTSKLPNATLTMLPEAGHFLQWDQPTAFNQHLYSFLQEQ